MAASPLRFNHNSTEQFTELEVKDTAARVDRNEYLGLRIKYRTSTQIITLRLTTVYA
jgi:hypothetical protein